ncbi:hypothetical protein ALC56_08189, partial [Trachymyrmex septentrionalis]
DGKEIFREEERVQRIIGEETKRKRGRRVGGIEKVEEGNRRMEVYYENKVQSIGQLSKEEEEKDKNKEEGLKVKEISKALSKMKKTKAG